MPLPTPSEFARKIKDILKHVQSLVDEARAPILHYRRTVADIWGTLDHVEQRHDPGRARGASLGAGHAGAVALRHVVGDAADPEVLLAQLQRLDHPRPHVAGQERQHVGAAHGMPERGRLFEELQVEAAGRKPRRPVGASTGTFGTVNRFPREAKNSAILSMELYFGAAGAALALTFGGCFQLMLWSSSS